MTVDAIITLHMQFASAKKELLKTGGFTAKMKYLELEKKQAELLSDFSEADVWFTLQYVDYLEKLGVLEAARVSAVKGLEIAQEEAKKNSWKWQARKTTEEPPMIVKARAAIVEVQKSVEALEQYYALTKKVISGLRAFDKKGEELRAWCDGGSEPDWIRVEEKEEREDLLEGCVILKRGAVQKQEEEEEKEEEEEIWHPLSVFDYAESLMPAPPPPPKEEEIVFSGRGGNSKLFKRLLKQKQEKDRATAAV